MHFPKILEEKGCGPDRLRAIFTSKGTTAGDAQVLTTDGTRPASDAPLSVDQQSAATAKDKSDYAIRQRFEERARSRILEGIRRNVVDSKPIQAVDIAMAPAPIQKQTIPLMLWAQGKLKMEELKRNLIDSCGVETAQKFFKKGEGDTLMLDLPRITETPLPLVHSMVTRRLAAVDALWSNLWPLFRYEPRGNDSVSQCRADALTQRVDTIADFYNYRHDGSQWRRDMLKYARSVVFPRSAWDTQPGWRYEKTNTGQPSDKVESYVVREGLDMVNPHPSRVYWDFGAPLSKINTDTGPMYIGYWDIVRYGTILDGNYFNTDRIANSSGFLQLLQTNNLFFSQYFDKCVLNFPDNCLNTNDPTLKNDRSANVGVYTSQQRDNGVLLTQHFEKINPKHEGIGDYDCNIWIRLVCAGDGTVVAVEFMPSIPACYGGINCDDNQIENLSMAMELLTFQDQLQNIVSGMVASLRASQVQLWLLDEDSLNPAIVAEIKKNAANLDWWVDPKVILYSAVKLKEMGITDPSQAFRVIQPQVQNAIEAALREIGQLLNLCDRMLNASPNELGQPNPREVSAHESQQISTTIQSIYAFITEGPREQIAAFKKLLYESLVTHGSKAIRVPAMRRYSKKTLKDAGFEVKGMDDMKDGELVDLEVPLMGNLHSLIYDYYFDSRDGAERPLNQEGAKTLTQLLQTLIQVPEIKQALGTERLFEMVNTIFRMSGAPYDMVLEMNEGDSGALAANTPQVTPQALQQISQSIEKLGMGEQRLGALVTTLFQALKLPMPPPQGQPQPGAAPQPGPQPQGAPPAGPGGPQPAAAAPPSAPGGPSPAAILQNAGAPQQQAA